MQQWYHTLPSAMVSLFHGGLLSLRKKPPTAELSPHYVVVSTSHSSDHLTLQSTVDTSTQSPELYNVFVQANSAKQAGKSKDADKKVKTLVHRLEDNGITSLRHEHAEHALYWCPDDLDAAYDLLVLVNESIQGEIKDYDANVHMLGAVNRESVTCYLDSLLFAMFARMDSFEAILYDEFSDERMKKLASVLRLYVNMLRTGRLIKTELTKHLQDSLATCGWKEAALIRQQDASEAFTFITGALDLPLLTLKMDIFHTGKENREDDHKFVNERLLDVSIPEQEGEEEITLEQCLESYFNNRIEVKRHLQRQNTLSSARDPDKNKIVHIETLEISETDSPTAMTPTVVEFPTSMSTLLSPVRPLAGRQRGESLFTERHTKRENASFDEKQHLDEMLGRSSTGLTRASSSLRKEVLMPAWQFFSLIPWYTDNMPKTDAQVAAHFSTKRPVLGICLKRYTMTPEGAPKRLDTFIDIPLEIGLPHFISDERVNEEGPLFGNFKLVLQSVVCHRGVSIDSGHYISLVRANEGPSTSRPDSSHSEEEQKPDSWLRYDDLANPRVVEVDIQKALREESPYLLFYQVQPIDEELAARGDPPPYAAANSNGLTPEPSNETLIDRTEASSIAVDTSDWENVTKADATPSLVETNSSEPDSEPIVRSSMSSHRVSISFDEQDRTFPRGRSVPQTPVDETKTGFLSTSRRNSKAWLPGSKHSTRPNSQNGENRLSQTLSRLTGRTSKNSLQTAEARDAAEDPLIVDLVNAVQSAQNAARQEQKSPVKETGGGTLVSPSKGKSKRDRKEEKKLRKASPEIINGVPVSKKGKAKGKLKERPDRECVVM
jgi:hypothetical protein